MKLAKRSHFLNVTGLLAFAAATLTASAANAGILLSDSFSYPDGLLSANAGWSPNATANSLVVSGGLAGSGPTPGEYNGFREFSRLGVLNETMTFSVDVLTPTHNSVASVVLPNTFGQVGGWTYVSSGWRFGSIQTSVTTGATTEITFDPVSGLMSGRLIDLSTGATLFQSADIAFNSPIQSTLNAYLYTDSRNQISTTQFDNLSVSTPSATVPEPTSLAVFGVFAMVALNQRRRRAN